MLNKLRVFEERYQELESRISDPELIANQSEWQKEMRAHGQLTPLVEEYRKYRVVMEGIQEAKEILRETSDSEMIEMAKAELNELEPQLQGQLASHSVDVFAKGFVEIELEIKLKIADGHTGYPRQHIGLCRFIECVRG